jgi:hypothetical protein
MALDDPTAEQPKIFQLGENIFLALYTFEMIMKILGLGFIFTEDAYLKEPWNILDFIIVLVSYFTLFTSPTSDT